MKKLSLIALAALLCSGLALTACKGGNKAADAADDYIAKTIFDLIPKEDLPDYCAHVQQTDYSEYDPADVPAFDPTFFAAGVEGHMVEGMDSGFYGYINVKCYPLESGGWRAYWVAYGGYDGLCGFDQGGAYNYVKGKLTKEEVWLLPTPDMEDMLSADLISALIDSGEWHYMDPNYSYTFGSGEDGLLSVTLDVDYLFYPEEGSDAAYPGSALDVDYGWNGVHFVRQDFDGLDDVSLNALPRLMGFNPEGVGFGDGGFVIYDPEEEEEGQINYYNEVQSYAFIDDLGVATSWLVFNYEVGTRELKAYNFDGTKLTPTKHMIVDDWNATKAENPDAEMYLTPVVIRFIAPVDDVPDYPIAGYTYDASCEGLFEPDDLFEE